MTSFPFGDKIKDLTPLQEAILTTIYMNEKLANYMSVEDGTLYVSGKFFLFQLGIVWETYHRKLLDELIELGWLEKKKIERMYYYSLTDTARVSKDNHWSESVPYTRRP